MGVGVGEVMGRKANRKLQNLPAVKTAENLRSVSRPRSYKTFFRLTFFRAELI